MRTGILSVVLPLCAVLAGCSAAEPRQDGTEVSSTAGHGEAPSPAAGRTGAVSVTLSVDPGARALGAYELVLRYDPAVIRVCAVWQPGGRGFPATPLSDTSTWRTGSTPILGFVVRDAPPGRIDVATVEFEWVAQGESSLSVSVRSLYSPEGNSIPGTALVTPARLSSR